STGISPELHAQSSRAGTSKQLGRPRKLAFSSTAKAKGTSEKANLIDAFRKIKSLDSIVPSQLDKDVWGHLPLDIRRELAREYVKTSAPKLETTTVDAATSTTGSSKALVDVISCPKLFGKHELVDVRALIKAWIDSCESGPLKEDVAEVGDYVVALIEYRNLFKAEDVLKHLKFGTTGRHPAWAEALTVVLDRANVVCMAMYNSKFCI
ncbi:hypothetical protein IWW38_004312, partial [Coemansia aciculifera]